MAAFKVESNILSVKHLQCRMPIPYLRYILIWRVKFTEKSQTARLPQYANGSASMCNHNICICCVRFVIWQLRATIFLTLFPSNLSRHQTAYRCSRFVFCLCKCSLHVHSLDDFVLSEPWRMYLNRQTWIFVRILDGRWNNLLNWRHLLNEYIEWWNLFEILIANHV